MTRYGSAVLLAALAAASPVHAQTRLQVEAQSTPDAEWKSYPTTTVATLPGYRPGGADRVGRYGGSLASTRNATGFFRTEKLGDRWWIIDPHGHPYFHLAVVAARPGNSPAQRQTFATRFRGDSSRWAAETVDLLRRSHFNGVGNWSLGDLMRDAPRPTVYTRYINPMNALKTLHRAERGGVYRNAGWQGYENDLIYVWDPRFERIVEEQASQLAQYRDEKYLLGYFSDNELPYKNDALDRHLKLLPTDDPGSVAAWSWFRGRKGVAADTSGITPEDRRAFLAFYADRYYSVVSRAIRKYDPNHMYLGGRFNQEREELQSPEIMGVAGKYADIVSVNVYRVWEPGQERLRNWSEWSGRPLMITEWYTKGADTGMPNTSGAGWIVRTQRDRGLFYQNFMLELLKSKVVVGSHWFRYQDNDPTDLTADPSNRDSNKGIVDPHFRPYPTLLREMETLNRQAYRLIDFFDRGAMR